MVGQRHSLSRLRIPSTAQIILCWAATKKRIIIRSFICEKIHMGRNLKFLGLLILVGVLSMGCRHHIADTGLGRAAPKGSEIVMRKSSEEIAKENHWELLHIGTNHFVDANPKVTWVADFMSRQKMTREQLQPIIEKVARIYERQLLADIVFEEYHAFMRSIYPKSYKKYASKGQIAFKLTFWDENFDRPLYPYIAQVRYVAGEIFYYYANTETQALETPPLEYPLAGY